MTLILINLSCSLIKDSEKESKKGTHQSGKISHLELNMETNTEYLGTSFMSMERTLCSSFRSIPPYLHWSTRDLNLVNNCSIVLKLLGCKDANSFSRMCP